MPKKGTFFKITDRSKIDARSKHILVYSSKGKNSSMVILHDLIKLKKIMEKFLFVVFTVNKELILTVIKLTTVAFLHPRRNSGYETQFCVMIILQSKRSFKSQGW